MLLFVQVVLHSGSYGLFEDHQSRPHRDVFDKLHDHTPNFSQRMTNVAAAMLRPQLDELPQKIERFNENWQLLVNRLRECPHIYIPDRHPLEQFVGSSLQFSLPQWPSTAIEQVVSRAKAHGVPMAWFGRREWMGFTSTSRHWAYAGAQKLPHTQGVLFTLLDLPLYHTSGWQASDFEQVAEVICAVVENEAQQNALSSHSLT